MIVFGAGPIAIEMAQAFSRLGTKMYVIQRSGQILSKEDKDMADILMNTLKNEGVIFYLNSNVIRVKDLGSERERYIFSQERNGSASERKPSWLRWEGKLICRVLGWKV